MSNEPLEIGDTINYLTIISLHHKDEKYRKFYQCLCKCGKKVIVNSALIKSGNTMSCGCYGKQLRREKNKLPNNRGQINQLILQYKRHAKQRGFEFNLEPNYFGQLIRQNCFYCNTQPNNVFKNKNCKEGFKYNGVDRVNSKLDYTVSNCVACCRFCNLAKRDMSAKEFILCAMRVAEQWG